MSTEWLSRRTAQRGCVRRARGFIVMWATLSSGFFGVAALGCGPQGGAPPAEAPAVVVVAPDDKPVHDCMLLGDERNCGAQPAARASQAAGLEQLARDALMRAGSREWPSIEVNRSFPEADALIERLKEAGAKYEDSDSFGPETPPQWVVSIGGGTDVRVMQAIIGAAVLSGADFGVEFIGARLDGGVDHSQRAYYGSLDAEADDPTASRPTLRRMLTPGATAASLFEQGFVDEEAPPR